jgi:hypothetical protein
VFCPVAGSLAELGWLGRGVLVNAVGWGFPCRFVRSPHADVVGMAMVGIAVSCRYSLRWRWRLAGRRWG